MFMKVHLEKATEYRKIEVTTKETSLDSLYKQIQTAFELTTDQFELVYKDRDGDTMVVSSLNDFNSLSSPTPNGFGQRVTESSGPSVKENSKVVLRLKPLKTKLGTTPLIPYTGPPVPFTFGSMSSVVKDTCVSAVANICVHCNLSLGEIRYKCNHCPEYFLCETCESLTPHPQHNFLKIRQPCDSDATTLDNTEKDPTEQENESPSPMSTKPFFSGPSKGLLSTELIKSMNLPEGSDLRPSQRFIKTWMVRNNGQRSWPEGCFLVGYWGDSRRTFGSDYQRTGPIPALSPGKEAQVHIELVAPVDTGYHSSYFRLSTPDHLMFGARLCCGINIIPAPALATWVFPQDGINHSTSPSVYTASVTSDIVSVTAQMDLDATPSDGSATNEFEWIKSGLDERKLDYLLGKLEKRGIKNSGVFAKHLLAECDGDLDRLAVALGISMD